MGKIRLENDHPMHINENQSTATEGFPAPPVLEKPACRKPAVKHFTIHKERPFLESERETTTVLTGGLSPAHDHLFEATLNMLGVRCKVLPTPDLDAFHTGREFGNNGFCNPAYFMAGNLINYLKELERSGLSKAEIIEHYVYFTAGCNAPCRFGLLETEYRMALEECGFEGFRVLVFQNEGGLKQVSQSNALEINPEFFLSVVNAINMADVLNGLVYATRPYEVVKGQTDEVMQKARDFLYQKIINKKKVRLSGKWMAFFKTLRLDGPATFLLQFWDQLTSTYYTDALRQVREMFEAIEVDRFRSKTIVKITGEFWAITTVGAGNFHMFRYLEREGAVLFIEPVGTLIQFLFSKATRKHVIRREIQLKDGVKHWWELKKRIGNFWKYQKKRTILRWGIGLYRREYARLLHALGGDSHMLIKQTVLQEVASPFMNINLESGEGYMEVAKNIYYHEHNLSHMVMSIKPFGCMPSTQSDGIQVAVVEKYKNMIFLPLETAAEGETNAQSRVLMALSDAHAKAKKELTDARKSVTASMEDMKSYVDSHPQLKSPFYIVPRRKGVVSGAANFLYHVDELIRKERKS